MDMHKMLMPDMTSTTPPYPQQYLFSTYTQNFYLSMPDFFQTTFNSFGNDSKTDPPQKASIPQLPASFDSAQNQVGSFSNYAVVALQLNQAFTDLAASDQTLAPLAQKTASISSAGQTEINSVIDSISQTAPTLPPQGMTEDDYIVGYLDKAVASAKTAIDKASTANQSTASSVDSQTKQIQDLQQQVQALQKQNAELQQELTSGGGGNNTNPYDPTALNPSSTNPGDTSWSPTDLGADNGAGTSPLTSNPIGDTGSGGGLGNLGDTGSGGGLGNLGDTGASAIPAAAVSPASGSSMGEMMSSMLPMMMMMQQQRGLGSQEPDNQQLTPERYQDYPAAMAPPSASPPAAASAQPPSASPAQSSTPQQGATAPPQPGAPATRTPGADGLVTYTFPDGRTQKVSPAVAQALDAAFSNNAGTDAQAAYSKTSGKWSDNKQIGALIDPSQCKTGDVATWDSNKTAILVVWGSGDPSSGSGTPSGTGTDGGSGSGSLEVIVDGQLVPFTEQISGKSGDFGNFAGFAHPNNIDASATQSDPASAAGIPAVDPSAVDPSAAAHAVAAPTS